MAGAERGRKGRPPTLAEAILKLSLPSRYRDQQLGDLREAFREIEVKAGAAQARRWYRRQVLKSMIPNLMVVVRRVKRATRSLLGDRHTMGVGWLQDIRYGAIVLRKTPAFAAVAAVTLALGIGTTTAVFSAMNTTLLRPLPFEDPSRLMRVSLLMPRSEDGTRREMIWSYPKYRLFRESQNLFESTATYLKRQYNLTDVDTPERLWAEVVGADYFSVLGVEPHLGRGFSTGGDISVGADMEAVLSYRLWVRRFGADPKVLGRTIHLDGTPLSVVGVMRSTFYGLREMADVWVPMSGLEQGVEHSRAHSYHVVARLRDGYTYDQVAAEMRALGERVDEAFPDREPWSATARPLDEYRVSDNLRSSVLLLFAAAGLVLLTACVNVAGLLLGRSVARRREVATRMALGCGRLRLVRQLLTESLMMSVLGGVLGVLLAWAGVRYFSSIGAASRFQMSALERTSLNSIQLDATALLFCVFVITATALLAGLWPAIDSAKVSLFENIKGGAAVGKQPGVKGRGALVVTQVALAFTLLISSGLLVRTMKHLNEAELGFDPEGVTTVRLALPAGRYHRAERQQFFDQLVERVGSLPGVTAVTFSNCVPFADGCRNTSSVLARDGIEVAADQDRLVGVSFVSPDYFETLGMPVSGGRTFTSLDRGDTPNVVVISQATARRYWPGEDAVGRSLSLRGLDGATVVGVVGDVRYDDIADEPRPNVYISASQAPRREGFLLARVSTDPESVVAAIRETVGGLDPNLPLFDVRTMRERVEDETWRTRFATLLISLFASMAFILSAIGIYAVLAYSVERQTREIGIRIALGATSAETLKSVVGRALMLAVCGIVVGSLAAISASRVLEALLYNTNPADPLTFGAVTTLFVAISLIACYVPARRANTVDPVEVLRRE